MEQFGEVGSSILFENDRVRIWEIDLLPGEELPMHHHDLDYSVVVIEGDRIAGIPAEGSSGKHVEADVSRQQTFSLKRGGTERAVNIGTKRFYEIQIELKG